VAKLNPAGSALVYSTYLGGTANEFGGGIAVDLDGNAYVVGYTSSSDFPQVAALQSVWDGGTNDAFVTKVGAGGIAFLFSTYLGGAYDDQAHAVAVDDAGVVIGGETFSPNFLRVGAVDNAMSGPEGFVTRLSPTGQSVVYSTWIGGAGSDRVNGVAIDPNGNDYAVGVTQATDFPIANPFQQNSGGGFDAFVTVFLAPDGGASLLGGGPDGGTLPDGGSLLPDGGAPPPGLALDVGCDCSSGGGALGWVALATLAAARSRRRRDPC
jgi:MYXO-CTERM domain-containing protein